MNIELKLKQLRSIESLDELEELRDELLRELAFLPQIEEKIRSLRSKMSSDEQAYYDSIFYEKVPYRNVHFKMLQASLPELKWFRDKLQEKDRKRFGKLLDNVIEHKENQK